MQPKKKEEEEGRLRIETKLQAVLGKWSLMKRSDKEYAELDKTVLELSGLFRNLK